MQQEQEIAAKIQINENEVRTAIKQIPEAAPLLIQRTSHKERTRGAALERLKAALTRAKEIAVQKLKYLPLVQHAQTSFQKSEELRWDLALSAIHIAKAESRKLSNSLISEEDLLQEGYIGLLRAAQRFEASRKIRFTTYARWWVRAQMTRALETKGRMIRLPGGAVEQIRHLHRTAELLVQSGFQSSTKALAKASGLDEKRVELLQRQSAVVSLSQPLEDGLSLIDRIPSASNRPDDNVYQLEALDLMNKSFQNLLDSRERYILTHHYGLNGTPARTMSDIGKSIGISRERVRQIELSVLAKLRTVIV